MMFVCIAHDSGGGDGVACLSQTLKALCVFVNLHSRGTHNDFIVLSTAIR